MFQQPCYLPLSELADLCNALGCDMLWSIPHGLEDAAVSSTAAMLAATLTGKLRQELSCEHWNYDVQYTFGHYQVMGQWIREFFPNATEATLDGNQAYALDSAHKFSLVKAAYTAAGRPNDCQHFLGAMAGNPGVASEMIAYCATTTTRAATSTDPSYAGPIAWDGLLIAPYISLKPDTGVAPVGLQRADARAC